MSEITIVRRRLAAVEEAIAILEREWFLTMGGGPVSVYTERLSVKIPEECGDGFLTMDDTVGILQDLLADLTVMAGYVENAAFANGSCEWHPIKDLAG